VDRRRGTDNEKELWNETREGTDKHKGKEADKI